MSYLSDEIQAKLRANGTIVDDEVVLKEGDRYIAINVLSNFRRIIHVDDFILEGKSHKKLLKG